MREHIRRIELNCLFPVEWVWHYLGDQIQNEFVELLGTTIKNIFDKVRISKYFSIALDCEPPRTNTRKIRTI